MDGMSLLLLLAGAVVLYMYFRRPRSSPTRPYLTGVPAQRMRPPANPSAGKTRRQQDEEKERRWRDSDGDGLLMQPVFYADTSPSGRRADPPSGKADRHDAKDAGGGEDNDGNNDGDGGGSSDGGDSSD